MAVGQPNCLHCLYRPFCPLFLRRACPQQMGRVCYHAQFGLNWLSQCLLICFAVPVKALLSLLDTYEACAELKNRMRPPSNTLVLNVLTVRLCTLPRHTSPIPTQPMSRRCAKGSLCGPLTCCLTLCALRTSLPSSRSISASGSSSGMCLAMWGRWGWCSTVLGVGISNWLLKISWHSRSGGRQMTTLPSSGSIWKPSALFPDVSWRSLFLNILHFLRGWGLLLSGQFLLGSSLVGNVHFMHWDGFVEVIIVWNGLTGFTGVVVLCWCIKLGSFRFFAYEHTNLQK